MLQFVDSEEKGLFLKHIGPVMSDFSVFSSWGINLQSCFTLSHMWNVFIFHYTELVSISSAPSDLTGSVQCMFTLSDALCRQTWGITSLSLVLTELKNQEPEWWLIFASVLLRWDPHFETGLPCKWGLAHSDTIQVRSSTVTERVRPETCCRNTSTCSVNVARLDGQCIQTPPPPPGRDRKPSLPPLCSMLLQAGLE